MPVTYLKDKKKNMKKGMNEADAQTSAASSYYKRKGNPVSRAKKMSYTKK